MPVLLPPPGPASAPYVVERLDGLVVTGGADVDPDRYGAEPHPRTASWRVDRDAWEVALLEAADGRALPMLGVCRGMQLMAVQRRGRLDQHLPDKVGHEDALARRGRVRRRGCAHLAGHPVADAGR